MKTFITILVVLSGFSALALSSVASILHVQVLGTILIIVVLNLLFLINFFFYIDWMYPWNE